MEIFHLLDVLDTYNTCVIDIKKKKTLAVAGQCTPYCTKGTLGGNFQFFVTWCVLKTIATRFFNCKGSFADKTNSWKSQKYITKKIEQKFKNCILNAMIKP